MKTLTIGLLLAGLAFGANDWREVKVKAVTYEIMGMGMGVCYAVQDGADEYTGCEVNKYKILAYPEDVAAVGDTVSYRLRRTRLGTTMYIKPQGGNEHRMFVQRTNKRPERKH